MSNQNQYTKPTPPGWPRISSSVFYEDAARAIDWLCSAFGFEVRLKIEGAGGRIEHSELTAGDGLIFVGNVGGKSSRPGGLPTQSPRSLGGMNTQMMCLFVDDVDAHARHAKSAGAKIIEEPSTSDYGEEYWTDRSYRVEDPEGHQWWFMQRLRGPGQRA
jgi:uncharacterized glyoxalase superfamily protein PhnB